MNLECRSAYSPLTRLRYAATTVIDSRSDFSVKMLAVVWTESSDIHFLKLFAFRSQENVKSSEER